MFEFTGDTVVVIMERYQNLPYSSTDGRPKPCTETQDLMWKWTSNINLTEKKISRSDGR